MSSAGDPFTLLNVFEAWIQVREPSLYVLFGLNSRLIVGAWSAALKLTVAVAD